MAAEPYCIDCGERPAVPHDDYPPRKDGACRCDVCGDERLEMAIDLEEQLEDALAWLE